MILGIHCSVRGGFLAALSEAEGFGCRAMQILSYRRHHPPSERELSEFKRARESSSVERLLVHARFVPFLASADEARSRHSSELLAKEIRWGVGLGAEAFILHAGAYSVGSEPASGLTRFAEGVEKGLQLSGSAIPILLENVPGGGRRMGGSLEELAGLGDALRRRNIPIAFCLDTAHAWAWGYDIASAEGMWKFLGSAHRILGAENIRAFHINDSKALLGSHRENHWHLGSGYLGTEGLKHLLGRIEFKTAIGILETPKEGVADEENLALARSLAAG